MKVVQLGPATQSIHNIDSGNSKKCISKVVCSQVEVGDGECSIPRETAASFGRSDILQWTVRRQFNTQLSRHDVSAAIHAFIASRHHPRPPFRVGQVDGEKNDEAVESAAAASGSLDLLKWKPEDSFTRSCGQRAFGNCALDHGPKLCGRRISITLDEAAKGDHLLLLEWLIRNYRTKCCIDTADSHGGCTTQAMNVAAGNGHLEMVKWLSDNRREGCGTDVMDAAASSGACVIGLKAAQSTQWMAYNNLRVVKWLHAHREKDARLQR
ncbi:Ankyrin repeat-containing domain [Phytophthora cactorum]|nr:Ankyrin repeat-containing domain [Phytophthora cactorum]